MYEKLNESSETEEKKRIRHVDKTKVTKNKEQTERYPKTRRLVCNKCSAPNGTSEEINAQNAPNWATMQNAADQ